MTRHLLSPSGANHHSSLQDSIFQNMTHQQFVGATQPKVQGSWNLHKHLPQDMDFYVLLSSSAGVAGSRGQGNYSAGEFFKSQYNKRINLV